MQTSTYTGMRLSFGKNSGKLYVRIAFDSNPIQHRRF